MARTPSAPTSDADLHSTRQMLDELDALMERMLSLPVEDDAEEPEPPPPPAAPAMQPAATVSASLTLIPPEPTPAAPRETQIYQARVAVPESDEERESASPSYFDLPESPLRDEVLSDLESKLPTLEETTLDWLQERESAVRTPPATHPETNLATLPELEVSRGRAQTPTPSSRPLRGFWLWLFLRALNGIFDLFTHLLGPAGEWLRGPRGRNVLGVTGILMLLTAAAWLTALWMQWL